MPIETLKFYNTFLAILALAALIAAAALTAYRLARGPRAAAVLGTPAALWMAWLVALVATVGSLIYSEGYGMVPCMLCWYQRIAMYPLSAILLVGAVRKEAAGAIYALAPALIGLGISIYHYAIQLYPALEGGACGPNPCSSRWVGVFGFVTIPFMAGAGFILIAVLTAFYAKGPAHE